MPILKNRCYASNKNISTFWRTRRRGTMISSNMTLPLVCNIPLASSISGFEDHHKFLIWLAQHNWRSMFKTTVSFPYPQHLLHAHWMLSTLQDIDSNTQNKQKGLTYIYIYTHGKPLSISKQPSITQPRLWLWLLMKGMCLSDGHSSSTGPLFSTSAG